MTGRKPETPAPLGKAELELLQYLDANPGSSVAEAVASYGGPRGLARTTVLTMMQRLVAKGYLKRRQVKSVYRYSIKVPAAKAVTQLVSDFVRGVLGGSVSPFVAYLNETHDLSESEVAELRSLVDRIESRSSRSNERDTDTPSTGEER